MTPEYVIYASYGSNLNFTRFMCYIRGGRPAGATRIYKPCRDQSPPLGSMPLALSGEVYFAWESPTWGGGAAFYDPSIPGEVAARGYVVTAEQFSDIAEQEMWRNPGADLDLSEVLSCGRSVLGPGRYETLILAGWIDGMPVLTFTCPWRFGEVKLNPPSAAYLSMLAGGLAEAHGWGVGEVVEYLSVRPGIAGKWALDDLYAVAGASRAA